MLKRLVNEAQLRLTLTTTGPLLIKSGYATLTGPDMTPVLTYRNGQAQVYIPGSSLKGVFRSHLEKVIRSLRPDQIVVADLFKNTSGPDQSVSAWLQERKNVEKEAFTNEIAYADSDPIARLFGSNLFIGRISIGDAYLTNEQNRLPTEQRDGVGIDRLTGGAAHGAKFELEVVAAGVQFQTDILLRNFECWQLGGVLLLVQDLHDELIRLGSGRSRGLGAVKGAVDTLHIHHLGPQKDRADNEIWGLGKFLGTQSAYGTQADDLLRPDLMPEVTKSGIRQVQRWKGDALSTLSQLAITDFVRRMDAYPVYKQRQKRAG